MVSKIKDYINDVTKEMKKVSWPTREQLRESTVVVLVTTMIITAFVYVVDLVMSTLVKGLFV
jgi:preprotein translocase subunit SecE